MLCGRPSPLLLFIPFMRHLKSPSVAASGVRCWHEGRIGRPWVLDGTTTTVSSPGSFMLRKDYDVHCILRATCSFFQQCAWGAVG